MPLILAAIIFCQSFLDKTTTTVASSAYEWDLTNSGKNVGTFAKFVNDIYIIYDPEDFRKRIVFNLTLVKYASEIANFRVLNPTKIAKDGSAECQPNLNVVMELCPYQEFVGFLHYDEELGHQIANAYNQNIFCAEQPIAKTVVDQILQLTFSLAIRILICVIYDTYFSDFDDVGGWQLDTLLSAFQILSTERGTAENG
ncbi:hypothetical protein niasHT_035734 [Heterodera trifolii]|uniref:Effector protein n=1 Tax=Heterodera trifolii TaxID=157864 RepID=A0ABD2IJA6_9BILA